MTDGDDDTGTWVQSPDPRVDRIDPGRPTIENAVFVLLGAFATLFAFGRVAGLV